MFQVKGLMFQVKGLVFQVKDMKMYTCILQSYM